MLGGIEWTITLHLQNMERHQWCPTEGDVYCYEVIRLELLTRRRPILADGTPSGESRHFVDGFLYASAAADSGWPIVHSN